jgi:cell shape-determining protein MreC
MSYLLDKRNQKKSYYYFFVGFLCLLFLFYFRSPFLSKFSVVSNWFFKPVVTAGHNLNLKLHDMFTYFNLKSSLSKENASLKIKLDEQNALMSNYDALLSENNTVRDIEEKLLVTIIDI